MAKLGYITVKFENTIMDICDAHPTCEGCQFWVKHYGCYFRGKTPREWREIREAQRRASEKMKGIEVQSCESDSRTCDFDSRLQQDDNGS